MQQTEDKGILELAYDLERLDAENKRIGEEHDRMWGEWWDRLARNREEAKKNLRIIQTNPASPEFNSMTRITNQKEDI